jgi:flavin reductase (DIM6/NTAB) family NADH-FMN oxidoreductase RutF
MIQLTHADIASADKQYRTNLINCLSGIRMAMLVGTQNQAGQTNLAIFNSTTHIGANPPLIGLIFRPDSVERHTLSNIRTSGHYTLNAVSLPMMQAAHQTSARYAADQSEFDACGFTACYSENMSSPYVAESPLRFGLSLHEEIAIQSNGTYLVIGQVQEIWIKAELLEADGSIRPDKADLTAVVGLDQYFTTHFVTQLPYAKV